MRGRTQNAAALERARRLRRSAEVKLQRADREAREREQEAEKLRRLQESANE